MKVNSATGGAFSRSDSARSSRRSTSTGKTSYNSSPSASPAPPRSPSLSYHCTVDPPNSYYRKAPASPGYSPGYSRSPGYGRSPSETAFTFQGERSPRSPRQDGVFDFPQKSPRSPNVPKSPRSPRHFSYEEDVHQDAPGATSFDLQSPPKSRVNLSKAYHRQQYQSSKSDSSNSKSSLEYKSTTKHPNGDYQDIEYKVCHSLDSSESHRSYRTEHR